MSKFSKKQELLKRAIALYKQDYKLITISRELNIHPSTLRNWLRAEGFKAKKNPHGENPKVESKMETEPQGKSEILLEESAKEDAQLKKCDDLITQYEDVFDIAEAQVSPGDKYNAFVAQTTIRKQEEAAKNLPPPRTWKEFDLVDRLMERKMGIDGNNGSNKIQIDVSILNKTKTVKNDPSKIVDVDPIEDK